MGYRIRTQLDNGGLAVEQNNYLIIVNAYIGYDLDTWSKFPFNNFKLKICMFGVTNAVKSSDKGKWLYRGYGILFDGAGSWSFCNSFDVEMLQFLVLIIFHYLMLIIARINF